METKKQSQRRDLEVPEEQQSGLAKQTESKVASLQALFRKLAYFDRATDEILNGNSKEAIKRQQMTLKTKLSEAYSLIEDIQCLKIDASDSDEAIDEWTRGNRQKILDYEAALAQLSGKLLYEEEKQRENERQEEFRHEAEARAQIRFEEEEEAEFPKRQRGEKYIHRLKKEVGNRCWGTDFHKTT